jgi:FKBP-type peptidyl-prolyl cis-trans isomerase FklB
VQEYFAKKEKSMNAEKQEKGKKAKAEGEKFLLENAKKEGVVTLPSGLQYKVLNEGNGKKPKATDQVRCHYEGFLIDGTVFDSSIQRGEPAVFPLNQAGQRVCSSCRKVRSIVSSSLICSVTEKAVPEIPYLPTLH